MATSDAEPREYSKAFERLVNGKEDLPGLLAYAIYKQAIREASTQGRTVYSAGDRSPTETEVAAYRTAADGMLASFADSVIEQSRERLEDTAIRRDLGRMEKHLVATIRTATTWRAAILTNLVAWLLSIAITFLIVLAGVPGWITALVTRLGHGG